MAEILMHRILIYLYEEDAINQDRINIIQFITSIYDEGPESERENSNNRHRIVSALQRLQADKFINISLNPTTDPPTPIIMKTENKTLGINVRLEWAGYKYILEYLRQKQQHESIIETNASIKLLNDKIPDINRKQRNLTIITLVVAGLSFFAIAFSAYFAKRAPTGEQLLQLNTSLQENSRLLDSMRQSQKGIDSSLRKAVKDSVKKIYVLKKYP
jgi:hypothetical protein